MDTKEIIRAWDGLQKSWAAFKIVTEKEIGISDSKISLFKRSEQLILLNDYTDFLLDRGYIDSDVYSEQPTAIDAYIKHTRMK